MNFIAGVLIGISKTFSPQKFYPTTKLSIDTGQEI